MHKVNQWIFVFAIMAGCASFGLPTPATPGQKVVQAYGNSLAVSAMLPGLLAPPASITPTQARNAQDASRAVRQTIDNYWDVVGLSECKDAPVPACEGPQAAQILTIINGSLIQVESFLLAHKGAR